MLSHFARIAALVVALMAVVGVAQASASTWTISGSTAFTATSGASSMSTSTSTLSCTGETDVGTFAASSSTSDPWNGAATGTTTFSGCRIGGTSYSVSGTYTLNLVSYDAATGVTSGNMAPAAYSVLLLGRQICKIVVTTARPAAFTFASFRFTFGRTTDVYTVYDGADGRCPLGNGVTLTKDQVIQALAAGSTTIERR